MQTEIINLNIKTPAWKNPDQLLLNIAEYVHNVQFQTQAPFDAVKICLLDSIGCALMAQKELKCQQLLGPWIPGQAATLASRVPGTAYRLDPIKAAFDISCCIRWLDFNDTWLAAEWGHPSDNIGAVLACADYISQLNLQKGKRALTLKIVCEAIIKAYEIQGILALKNSFNQVGLDHVVLVKVASAAVSSWLLGGNIEHTISAVSNAWVDGQSLRTYRHGQNTGPRKSWAAGDAASTGVRLAWMSVFGGDLGCPNVLTAEKWGFESVLMKGKSLVLERPLNSYVSENILYKVHYPAEFHAQTAVEAAIALHPKIKDKLQGINKIKITTQESAMRIINKTGALNNYADRDHCIQYMVAVALLFGDLKASYYYDEFAKNSDIDLLRSKMVIEEDQSYSQDYLDPEKRAIANAVQVFFEDGTSTDKIEIHYPLGHRRRREEAKPYLLEKYTSAVNAHYTGEQRDHLLKLWTLSDSAFYELEVNQFMNAWAY